MVAFVVALTAFTPMCAQNKGEPGKFDFYLLDMPWGPDFCSIADVSPQCKPQRSFVVHGLWPQNNDGSYPVFCSQEPGPLNPRENLDLTPDLHLLAHEWDKHGTCSAQGPQRFFQMEREAFTSIDVPLAFDHIDHETTMSSGADSRSVLQGESATAGGQPGRELPRRSLHRGRGLLHDECEADAVSWPALLHEAAAEDCASTSAKTK